MKFITEKFSNIKEFWNSDKFDFILTFLSWVFFIFLMCTLQLFTSMEGMSFLPIVFSILLFITTILHIFKKGKIAVTIPILFLFVFIIYAFIITALTSRVFEPYFKTMVNISIMGLVVFLFGINFNKPKYFFITYIFSAIILATTFVIVCRKDIFSLSAANIDRIGEQFGNVNGVGLTFCFGIICNSIFIVYYKKARIALAILDFAFLFLILKTGSRSSFIIAVVALLLCLILSLYKKHKIILLICIALLISIIVFLFSLPQFSFFRDRFLSLFGFFDNEIQTEASARIRHDMQINGMELWLKKMFFGYGSEGFKQMTSYPYYSHATLSEILCNYGLFGFLLFYFPFVYSFITCKRRTLGRLVYLFLLISILIPTLFSGIIFYEKPFFVFVGLAAAISFCEEKETKKIQFVISFSNWFKNIKTNLVMPKNIQKVRITRIKKPKTKHLLFFLSLMLVFTGTISSFSLTKKASYECVSSIVTQVSTLDSKTKSMNLNLQSRESEVDFNDLKGKVDMCRTLTYSKTSGELYNYRLGYFAEYDTFFTFDNADQKFSMLPHTTSGIHENDKKENVFDWYEIKMQYGTTPHIFYELIDTFIEVRESTAKEISRNLGIDYSKESFKELLDNGLFINATFYNKNQISYIKYQVANVIIENEGQDSFYYETFGDYFCSYLRNKSIPLLDNYSINYDFGSSFIENYKSFQFLEENFSKKTYDYKISKNNLIDKDRVETNQRIDQFFDEYNKIHDKTYFDDMALFFIIVALLMSLFISLCFLSYKKRIKIIDFSNSTLLLIVLSYFFSYVLFYFLNLIYNSKFTLFFSISGIFTSFFVFMCFVVLFLIFYKCGKKANKEAACKKTYLEIEC